MDILAALRHLHDRDPVVMHRDLKPANILLPRARRAPLRLADFGLAKSFERGDGGGDSDGGGGIAAAGRDGSGGVLVRAHTCKVGGRFPARRRGAGSACALGPLGSPPCALSLRVATARARATRLGGPRPSRLVAGPAR